MDLFGALELGKRSLLTYQFALNVTGHNISNVATEGFTRRRVELQPALSVPLVPKGYFGTGVDLVSMAGLRDRLIESQIQREAGRSGYLDSRLGALRGVLLAIDESSAPGIGAAISEMFDAFSTLATQPENPALRRTVVEAASHAAAVIRQSWTRLEDQRLAIDRDAATMVAQINTLTSRIASLNLQIAKLEAGGKEASDLRDSRGVALKELSGLIDISAYEDQRGNVQVSLAATGDALVATSTAAFLTARPDPSRGGLASIEITRAGSAVDLTDRLRGGNLGALLEARDGIVAGTQADLDRLASALISEINAIHRAGFDLSGNAGGDFFTTPAAGSSAARTLSVNPALEADPALVAAAGSAAPGDGAIAIAIAEIRNTRLAALGSVTPAGFLGAVVGRIGFETASSEAALAAQGDLMITLQARLDEVSGVSLDEEAVRLTQYQAAYQAAARFIQTIDELTRVALSLGAEG